MEQLLKPMKLKLVETPEKRSIKPKNLEGIPPKNPMILEAVTPEKPKKIAEKLEVTPDGYL